ncbi:hypothetical protein ACHAXH_001751 [Discostella pseudostelligera]
MCIMTALPENGSVSTASASATQLAKLDGSDRQRQPEQPEDKHQAIVDTPYGRGLVVRTRKCDGIKEIQLLGSTSFEKMQSDDDIESISAARGSSSTTSERKLYTTMDYPSITPQVGDDVICQFGRGRIQQISCMNNCGDNEQPIVKYTIELSSWRLRGRSTVLCHIITTTTPNPSLLRVVRKHTYHEMDAVEKVELARSRKAKATHYFTQTKDYNLALSTYANAVDALRSIHHDHTSTNEVRADLLLLLITCSNNAATCCVKLDKWEEATKFAQNALILIDALHEKRGKKIHTILNKEGTIDAQLFGEWRVKSYLIMARSFMKKGDDSVAMGILKKAHLHAMGYMDRINAILPHNRSNEETVSCKSLVSQIKDIRRHMSECSDKNKATKEIEKRRAKAMFGGTKSTAVKKDSTVNSVSPKELENDQQQQRKRMMDDNKVNGTASSSINSDEKDAAHKTSGTPACKKCVTFSQHPPQVKEFEPHISSDAGHKVDESWYNQHKEALIVMAVAGLSAMALISLKKFAR